ncbi:MAG: hypothetical protein EOP33_03230 [Rickettsiaceae bacterium]|nr:MAG: hypothetical protein EOP33_03230 [Rickettsiaceae bacterium]
MRLLSVIDQISVTRIFKKLCVILAILLISIRSNESLAFSWAEVAQAISTCFKDPCNCGSTSLRKEIWGDVVNSFQSNPNCPPYNRNAGRDDNTCLVAPGHPYPSNFTSFYITRCAEQAPDSSYFTPKIRIRNQNCNAFACWSVDTTLNWDGQCVLWGSAYGLPIIRICARIAQAANSENGAPADDGYTQGTHLDFKGQSVDDEKIFDYAGNETITINSPKLCAYNDPSAIDTLSAGGTIDGISFPDLMDMNPLKQPLHKTTQLSIVSRIILLFIKLQANTVDTLISLLEKVFGATSSSSSSLPNINIFKPIFESLGKIIQLYFDKIAEFIEKYGGLNAVVNSSLGCVNIPLGPFPPPFCSSILPYIPIATTQKICDVNVSGSSSDMIDHSSISVGKNSDDTTNVIVAPSAPTKSGYVKSVDSAPCVISTADNNAINNSVRISFDNFIPLCANNENPLQTDKCVVISRTPSNPNGSFTASNMHQSTKYQDMIQRCPSDEGSGFCVQLSESIDTPCDNISGSGCSGGFRIVYAANIGTTSIPSTYYMDDMADCNSNNSFSISCQSIWGINSGRFIDVSLKFPEQNDQQDLVVSATLGDTNNQGHTFLTKIVRQQITDAKNGFTQNPNQICVTESNTLGYRVVGCEERAAAFETLVENCAPENSPYCVSSYWVPSFIIKMRSFATPLNPNNIYLTADILSPSSVSATSNTKSTINLAGFNFDSFVTDDSLLIKPFTDSHVISKDQSSRYGNYKNNANPTTNTKSVYLNGLEYYRGSYVEGGKYACANFQTIYHCPINQQNCVLAKLVGSDNVDCSSFTQKLQLYPDLVMCYSGMNISDQPVDSIKGKNGQPAVSIYTVTNSSNPSHCYLSLSNQAICTPSILNSDRISPTPDASIGPMGVLTSDQYYSANLMQNYDSSVAGLRDKSPLELGRCVEITQPVCPAITTPGPDDGNATWVEGKIGTQSAGTCIANSVPIDPSKPLLRYCLADVKAQKIAFENLDSGVGCVIPAVKLGGGSSSNFPQGYQLSININDNGGTIVIQCATDSCAALVANQLYNYNFNPNISAYYKLQQFKITNITGSGVLNISVNNNNVTTSANNVAGFIGTDINQYLKEGDNKVVLQLKPNQSAAANSFSITIQYSW